MYKDLPLGPCIFKIMPFFPKLLSCPESLRTPGPVFVRRQNKIFPRKRLTQTDVSATLLHAYQVFSSICE